MAVIPRCERRPRTSGRACGAWAGGGRPPGLAGAAWAGGGGRAWSPRRSRGAGPPAPVRSRCDSQRRRLRPLGDPPRGPHAQTGCSADRRGAWTRATGTESVSSFAGGAGAERGPVWGRRVSSLISDPGGLTLAWPGSCWFSVTPLGGVSPRSLLGRQRAVDVAQCGRGGWWPAPPRHGAGVRGTRGGAWRHVRTPRWGRPWRPGTRHAPDVLRGPVAEA